MPPIVRSPLEGVFTTSASSGDLVKTVDITHLTTFLGGVWLPLDTAVAQTRPTAHARPCSAAGHEVRQTTVGTEVEDGFTGLPFIYFKL